MPDGTRYPDILVVDLPGGFGDLVMVLPVIHALARRNPGAALRVLTHGPGAVLVESDPALVVSTTRHSGIPDEIESRTSGRTRRPTSRSAPATCGSSRPRASSTTSTCRPRSTSPPLSAPRGARMVVDLVPAARADAGPPVVLVPGAGMAVKQWPHWRALARALAERGRSALVVTGGRAPGAWAEEFARPLPPTGLRELAAVFAAVGERGGTVVGPDTGPVRMAAAVGTRTVGLFGPTAAARYGLGPAGVDLQGLPGCPHRRPTAIAEQVCWWDARCPLAEDGPACMRALTVAAVLRALHPADRPGTPMVTESSARHCE